MIEVRTDHPVATDSPDHLHPIGTRMDNSTNQRFNNKLYFLFRKQLRVLDLGCSGGGFVRNCIDDGHIAVGLEGSDYSKKIKRAEWRTIPDNLFTCDITKPFEIFEDGSLMLFDVVTAWDFMEHIAEKDLPQVIANIKKHLKPGGLFIANIAYGDAEHDGWHLHQTMQKKPWWLDLFSRYGLTDLPDFIHYFNTQYVRVAKDEQGSFSVVLSKDPALAPKIIPPRNYYLSRMYDRWLGSKYQKYLKRLVIGETQHDW